MAEIQIPAHLRDHQGKLVRGEFYWVDVKLHDGRVMRGLVSHGDVITGVFTAADGARDCDLPFTSADIEKVRPHSMLPFW